MTSVWRTTIDNGETGTRTTLSRMVYLVREGITKPKVVELAHSIVMSVPERDYLSMALRIRDWMRGCYHFIPDPVGVEMLRTPEYMVTMLERTGAITGDCDDASIMAAALGASVGIAGEFRAVSYRSDCRIAHVYTVLSPRGQRVSVRVDVTRPPGAPDFRETRTIRVSVV